MAKKKLQRRKLTPRKTATVTPISPSGRFEVYIGHNIAPVSCIELMGLHDADRIVRGLNLFLRDKRVATARLEATVILSYLRYALTASEVVNTGRSQKLSATPD